MNDFNANQIIIIKSNIIYSVKVFCFICYWFTRLLIRASVDLTYISCIANFFQRCYSIKQVIPISFYLCSVFFFRLINKFVWLLLKNECVKIARASNSGVVHREYSWIEAIVCAKIRLLTILWKSCDSQDGIKKNH